jgi:hypothetical protein
MLVAMILCCNNWIGIKAKNIHKLMLSNNNQKSRKNIIIIAIPDQFSVFIYMKLIDVTWNQKEKKEIRGIIYSIANTKTGKIYIGQTIYSFNNRYSRGKWWLYSDNKELKEDYEIYKKYFKIFILESGLSINELNEKETFYIQKLNTLSPNGYNKTLGGFNKSLCEEAKMKLSQIRIGAYAPSNKKNSKFLGVRYCKNHQKFKCCFENKLLKKTKYFEDETMAAEFRDFICLYLYGVDNCILNFPEKLSYYLSFDLEEKFQEFLSPKNRAGLYRNAIPLPNKNKLIKMLKFMNTTHLCQIFKIKKSNLSQRLHNLNIWASKIPNRLNKKQSERFFKKYMNLYIRKNSVNLKNADAYES